MADVCCVVAIGVVVDVFLRCIADDFGVVGVAKAVAVIVVVPGWCVDSADIHFGVTVVVQAIADFGGTLIDGSEVVVAVVVGGDKSLRRCAA